MTRALMIQGTGSDVGKSVLTAGLCRAFRRRGLNVAPFKPQNMSNNAAVTVDGGEIGRAQALQARACGLAPNVHMNPVLLKPETDRTSQAIVQGRVSGELTAMSWRARKERYLPAILESFREVTRGRDLVLVEGAGSPAETNLRAGDVANMGFAEAAGVPAILVGDINRGGVIASLVGSHTVLSERDRARIRGFIINKFRGDPALFSDALIEISERTGWRALGIVPWLASVGRLPAEDAVPLEDAEAQPDRDAYVRIVVPMLSRIANFDDLDPLRAEPKVSLVFVPPGRPLPLDADAVILPGTKSTLGDLDMLRAQGWDIDILAMARAGKRVLGLCGGYQMLGTVVRDPDGADGSAGHRLGLGLLDVETDMAVHKVLTTRTGTAPDYKAAVKGYEIHMGQTRGADCARPLLDLDGEPDGARSPNGRIEGTYLHGLFDSDTFRRAWLDTLRPGTSSSLVFEARVEETLDTLAVELGRALDLDHILNLAEAPGWSPN